MQAQAAPLIDAVSRERLFGYTQAFEHPVTLGVVVAIVAVLAATPLVYFKGIGMDQPVRILSG